MRWVLVCLLLVGCGSSSYAPEHNPSVSGTFVSTGVPGLEVAMEGFNEAQIDLLLSGDMDAANAAGNRFFASYPQCHFFHAQGAAFSVRSASATIAAGLQTAPVHINTAVTSTRPVKPHSRAVYWLLLATDCVSAD